MGLLLILLLRLRLEIITTFTITTLIKLLLLSFGIRGLGTLAFAGLLCKHIIHLKAGRSCRGLGDTHSFGIFRTMSSIGTLVKNAA